MPNNAQKIMPYNAQSDILSASETALFVSGLKCVARTPLSALFCARLPG